MMSSDNTMPVAHVGMRICFLEQCGVSKKQSRDHFIQAAFIGMVSLLVVLGDLFAW